MVLLDDKIYLHRIQDGYKKVEEHWCSVKSSHHTEDYNTKWNIKISSCILARCTYCIIYCQFFMRCTRCWTEIILLSTALFFLASSSSLFSYSPSHLLSSGLFPQLPELLLLRSVSHSFLFLLLLSLGRWLQSDSFHGCAWGIISNHGRNLLLLPMFMDHGLSIDIFTCIVIGSVRLGHHHSDSMFHL